MDMPDNATLETSDIDLAPFDFESMTPFFDKDINACLGSLLKLEVPRPQDYKPSSYEVMTIALLRALLPVFLPDDVACATQ